MVANGRSAPTGSEIASWVLAGMSLLLVLLLHLLPALLSGLLVYELVHILVARFPVSRLSGYRAKLLVISLLAIIIVACLFLLIWSAVHFFRSGTESIPALLKKMAEIIDGSRRVLPDWLVSYLPGDVEELKQRTVRLLHEHAGEVEVAGREAGRMAAHIVIGMVIGALVCLREAVPMHEYRPLGRAMVERTGRLSRAFRAVVFAQVRIAAVNTFFAWLYLGVILPLLGIHLPLIKTMVAITFVTGLIPVAGNLVSNTVIAVVSLSYSLGAALGSLVFLVVIHKLEYFLNARIVGSQIRAQAWEILLSMLVMEAAFGIAGLIAAPVFYAYVKSELTDRGLV